MGRAAVRLHERKDQDERSAGGITVRPLMFNNAQPADRQLINLQRAKACFLYH
jgi:hypothetical protein